MDEIKTQTIKKSNIYEKSEHAVEQTNVGAQEDTEEFVEQITSDENRDGNAVTENKEEIVNLISSDRGIPEKLYK